MNSEVKTGAVMIQSGSVKTESEKTGGFSPALFDWVELFALSLTIVVVLMTFFVRHSPVIGSSMEPTVNGSQTVYDGGKTYSNQGDVMLISDLFYTPKTGDVVVINSPHNFDEPIIKRVIAVGGQTVTLDFENWKTIVDGETLDEPYFTELLPLQDFDRESWKFVWRDGNPNLNDRQRGTDMQDYGLDQDGDGFYTVTVPEGQVFVMGDHRNNSKDSRILGCIDERYILGKVLLRIYPFDRFGTI